VLFALLLLGAGAVDASAQGVNADEALSSEPGVVSEPMAAFARMEAGEWRLGTIQTDTWRWGPGRRSMRVQTVGSDGGGNPWRELVIYYWRPDRGKIRLLSFHPDIPALGRGVGEGTIEFHGESAATSLDLYQPGHPGRDRRKMAQRWTFDGPDKYHEVLLEDSGVGLTPLAEWDYARSTEQSDSPAPAPGRAPTPSKNIRAFVPLLGQWESREEGGAILARSNFEWMEYLDVVALRVEGASKSDEPEHLLDAYFYHHVGADELRCLALSASGAVYEGGVTVLEGSALQLDLTRYEGQTGHRRVVRIDFEPDGALRTREWSVDGSDRTLVFDVNHRKLEPPKD
jgi:hypothetical protein